MIRPRLLPLLAALLGLGVCAVQLTAQAGHKGKVMPPARVHFSGNLEGELEPCG